MGVHDLPEKVEIILYTTGLIDILNQREFLYKWGTEAEIDAQNPSSVEAIGRTLGNVMNLRHMLEQFATNYNRSTPLPESILQQYPNKVDEYIFASTGHIELFAFSDTVVLFSPTHVESKFHMKSVFGILLAFATTQLVGLAGRVATRAAVDIDLGSINASGDLYGPCIAKPYRLESEVAKYPRTLVSHELVDQIKQAALQNDFNAIIAELAIGMITTDSDGELILDYAGETMRNLATRMLQQPATKIDLFDMFGRALAFARESRVEHANNAKLAQRYDQLIGYLSSRQHLWIQ